MRIVLTGSPGNLYRATPADLPADLDLRQSYVRYVDFSGADLSNYDMRDMDVLDCNGNNVILPGQRRTDYLMSRRTSWVGAAIPADANSFNADFMIELIRAKVSSLSTANKTVANDAIAYLRADYHRSWQDSAQYLMTKYGITPATYRSRALLVAQNFPRLAARLRRMVASNRFSVNPPDIATPLATLQVRYGPVVDVSGVPLTLDRYQAAIDLKAAIEALIGEPVYVYVAQLDPEPSVIAVQAANFVPPSWDWWYSLEFAE